MQAVFESTQNTLQASTYRLYICAHRSDSGKKHLWVQMSNQIYEKHLKRLLTGLIRQSSLFRRQVLCK